MTEEAMADVIGKTVTTIDTGEEKLPDIIHDLKALKAVSEPVQSKEEGEKIAKILFQVLDAYQGGGLSAVQIGINKRVFVVKAKYPSFFINPKIEDGKGQLVYIESCLSFPVFIRTARYESFTLTADNLSGPIIYDVSQIPVAQRMQDSSVLEMVMIQHEYDHLDGKLMFDREYKLQPIHVGKKYGRNEKISITDGNTTLIIKYKKAEALLKAGKWKIVG